ncbi:hypothetical protein CL632_00745 [bacterium]|jgi:O-antigen ligase|nr:hypothetical protein [bacterium]MDP6571483.1 O-antigen ligase family protein [Patescibacteria group bacterium]MDP6756554.1 O-antigen ligase family protein [Patescibacteria group bacterium]|tara:strand:- start:42498 stop:43946 length:1449 start_codon:yes stop_codon:yes gene_type:complete
MKKGLILNTLIIVLIAELLSYLSYVNVDASPWIFGFIATSAIFLTVYRLEYGVMLIFGELIIGSLGKMFILDIAGFDVTIRMTLWLIVILVWLAHALKDRKIAFLHSKLFKPYLGLAIIIIWGTIWGILRGNGLGSIFSDVNNYMYFALIFPIYDVLSRSKHIAREVSIVVISAIAWLSVKTIALFYIFSHELFGLQDRLYDWSRYSRLGEITNIDPNILTSRIFMQSQIWLLFGLFALLGMLYGFIKLKQKKYVSWIVVLIIVVISAISMSFSRSFWLAGIASLVVMLVILVFNKEKIKQVSSFGSIFVGLIVISIGLTVGVAMFPIPKGTMSADLLKDRAAKFSGEAAVSSRYSQIRPLLSSIKNHPIYGSGFGTSVTYASQDPRVLKNNPDGLYTTTAFELGWLEIWLKIGLLGVGFYLYLLWMIAKFGWRSNRENYLILGGIIGLVAVVLTHGVSPYLNHPLGIGVVMLMSGLVDKRN